MAAAARKLRRKQISTLSGTLNYQSESRLQCPGFGNWACKKPKTRILSKDSTDTVRMSGF